MHEYGKVKPWKYQILNELYVYSNWKFLILN